MVNNWNYLKMGEFLPLGKSKVSVGIDIPEPPPMEGASPELVAWIKLVHRALQGVTEAVVRAPKAPSPARSPAPPSEAVLQTAAAPAPAHKEPVPEQVLFEGVEAPPTKAAKKAVSAGKAPTPDSPPPKKKKEKRPIKDDSDVDIWASESDSESMFPCESEGCKYKGRSANALGSHVRAKHSTEVQDAPVAPPTEQKAPEGPRERTRLSEERFIQMKTLFPEVPVPRWAITAGITDFNEAMRCIKSGGLNAKNFNAWVRKYQTKPAASVEPLKKSGLTFASSIKVFPSSFHLELRRRRPIKRLLRK